MTDVAAVQRLAGSMAILCARIGRMDLTEACWKGQAGLSNATGGEPVCAQFEEHLQDLKTDWVFSVRAHRLWEN